MGPRMSGSEAPYRSRIRPQTRSRLVSLPTRSGRVCKTQLLALRVAEGREGKGSVALGASVCIECPEVLGNSKGWVWGVKVCKTKRQGMASMGNARWGKVGVQHRRRNRGSDWKGVARRHAVWCQQGSGGMSRKCGRYKGWGTSLQVVNMELGGEMANVQQEAQRCGVQAGAGRPRVRVCLAAVCTLKGYG